MAAGSSDNSPEGQQRRFSRPRRRLRHFSEHDDDTAHRLKNSLAGIMARISLVAMDERVPKHLADELKDISDQCVQAGKLVDRLSQQNRERKAS